MIGRNLFSRVKKWSPRSTARNSYNFSTTFVRRRPLVSLFIILGLLLLFIIVGSFLRSPESDPTTEEQVRTVATYSIGDVPRAQFQAQVEKSGIVKILAISGGVVSNIHVTAGQEVSSGTTLVSLSSNYGGGNALSIQRQLAASAYQNAQDTNQLQKDIIAKQREIAEKNEANDEELRDIARDSLEANESLLEFNEGILDSLQENLDELEENPDQNEDLILSTQQMISQFRSGLNQLRVNVEQAQYTTDEDNPPARLSDLAKELTLKQLELQEKNLALSLETSRLQLRLAQVQEATMYPSAPFAGVVERVHVQEGTYVNPGAALVTLHGEQTVQAIVKVPRDIARSISILEPSLFSIGSESYEVTPYYVSTEATDGQLYTAQYSIPERFQNAVTHMSYIPVEIPLGYPDSGTTIPFVPIESVFQTQDSAYIFVYEDGIARSKEVQLGTVSGRYVEVASGLEKSAVVILDRDVIDGTEVAIDK